MECSFNEISVLDIETRNSKLVPPSLRNQLSEQVRDQFHQSEKGNGAVVFASSELII